MSTWSSRAQKPSRKRSINIRRPRITKVSGAWGAITAVIGLVAVTVQTTGLIVTALIALTGTVVTAFAGDRVAVQTRRASAERKSSPGKSRVRRPSAAKPGTPVKRRKCSSACRRSTKDAKTCDCSCRGKSHGSEITRSGAQSTAMKQRERQVVRAQRKATP